MPDFVSGGYDAAQTGVYIFTPLLPGEYALAEGVSPPVAWVTVGDALRQGAAEFTFNSDWARTGATAPGRQFCGRLAGGV
jgi:hypothetical protein